MIGEIVWASFYDEYIILSGKTPFYIKGTVPEGISLDEPIEFDIKIENGQTIPLNMKRVYFGPNMKNINKSVKCIKSYSEIENLDNEIGNYEGRLRVDRSRTIVLRLSKQENCKDIIDKVVSESGCNYYMIKETALVGEIEENNSKLKIYQVHIEFGIYYSLTKYENVDEYYQSLEDLEKYVEDKMANVSKIESREIDIYVKQDDIYFSNPIAKIFYKLKYNFNKNEYLKI